MVHCLALAGSPSRSLSDERASDYSVLVAYKFASQVAVTFFAAADECGLAFVFTDDFCDVLKAREHVVILHAEFVSHCFQEFGGYDGLHDVLFAVEFAVFLPFCEKVVCEDCGGLVAVHQYKFIFVVPYGDAHAVCVGVGSHHEIRAFFFGEFDGECESLGVFRVGRDYGREVAVGDALFGYCDDVFKSLLTEDFRHEPYARAVYRSIDNLDVLVLNDVVLAEREGLHFVQINLVEVFAEFLDEVGVALELDVRDFHCGCLLDDIDVVGRHYLCAVVPICLVAVVFLGVVGCRNHHAAVAAELAHCKREHRHGAQRFKEVRLYAVGREDVGAGLGEELTVVAAVVSDNDLDGLTCVCLVEVVGEALSRHTDGVNVHSVGAHAHNAAQAARAKFEALVETFDEFLLVVFNHILYLTLCFLVKIVSKPFFGSFENLCIYCHNRMF